MRKYLLLLLPLLVFACNGGSDKTASDKAYAMLERVAELNAGGNKPAALALAALGGLAAFVGMLTDSRCVLPTTRAAGPCARKRSRWQTWDEWQTP